MDIFTEELENIIIERAKNINYNLLDFNFEQLYNFMISDKNSSKLKEYVTARIANYDILPGKHGRDCISQDEIKKEIKPESYYNTAKRGTGHFSDYTFSRFQKDLDYELQIVSSLFFNHKVIYVVEFPISDVKDVLADKLYQQCVEKGNRYCRTCGWDYTHWVESDNLIVYYLDKQIIEMKKDEGINLLVSPFYKKLLEL